MVLYGLRCRGHHATELDTDSYVPNGWDCDPCWCCFDCNDIDEWVEEFLELYD